MLDRAFGKYFMDKAAIGAETISAAAAVHGGLLCMKPCVVNRLMFVITTLVASDTTLGVLEFNRRPTPGSATGEVALGTLTIPDASAVGAVIYKDIDGVQFNPGDELSFEHTVQCADGSSAAGAGYYGFNFEDSPEDVTNITEMVASA